MGKEGKEICFFFTIREVGLGWREYCLDFRKFVLL